MDSLTICLEKGVVGARGHNANRLKNIKIGDLVIFYVSREKFTSMNYIRKFCSIVKCTGPSYESKKMIWSVTGEMFSTRLPIEVIHHKTADIEPLIKSLKFIKNKKNWGSAFISGIRKITYDDFKLIEKNMK